MFRCFSRLVYSSAKQLGILVAVHVLGPWSKFDHDYNIWIWFCHDVFHNRILYGNPAIRLLDWFYSEIYYNKYNKKDDRQGFQFSHSPTTIWS